MRTLIEVVYPLSSVFHEGYNHRQLSTKHMIFINHQLIIYIYVHTSLGTQRCPGISVTSAVYPHLVDLTGKQKFLNKSRPTKLKSNKKHFRSSPEFLNKNERQIGPGVPEL